MSYSGISVKEALNKINQHESGWYLPHVQRQYVWGDRDNSEEYICLLLDSILNGYPIGGIVLWETNTSVPHRPFLTEYKSGIVANLVDEGLYTRSKSLIYDGQQRLQTLFSALRYSINGRVLCYDLLFDKNNNEADETGFYFINRGAEPRPGSIKLNTLCALSDNIEEKENIRNKEITLLGENDKSTLLKQNLDLLWDMFVKENAKSIAYFTVKSANDVEVNEVFRRLNTGGIPLTQSELVKSKVSANHPNFEYDLLDLSNTISNESGITYSASEILQLIFLLVKKSTRVSAERLTQNDLQSFVNYLNTLKEPLIEFFRRYLRDIFNINERSIIPRGLALLPIICYFVQQSQTNREYRIRVVQNDYISPINQYFILSQLNDWNTQTMVTKFTEFAISAANQNQNFPLEEIRGFAISKGRLGSLNVEQLLSNRWFSLKIIAPSRQYHFAERKPQIDHIFPKALAGQGVEYPEQVDILWNLQPVPAEINNFKRASHPHDFFRTEQGGRYIACYDYIPDLDSELWQNHMGFINERKRKIIEHLNQTYSLDLQN